MNQGEFNNKLAKLTDQIRELEIAGRQQGNTSMYYTTEDLNIKIKSGEMPQWLGEWHQKWLDEKNRDFVKWQKFIKDNPDIPERDRWAHYYGPERTLSFEETLKSYEEMVNLGLIHNIMAGFKGVNVSKLNEEYELPVKLFKNIADDEFALSRLMADPLNNLHKMIKSLSEPEDLGDNTYLIYSDDLQVLQKDKIKKTRIERRYKASNQEEAQKLRNHMIERLDGRQLKVLLACWAMANRKWRTFTCGLTELMQIANPNRNSSFNSNQKREFYQDLLDLSDTKFVIQSTVKTKKEELILPFIQVHKTIKMEVKARSLEMLKGIRNKKKNNEKINQKEMAYPTEITISVLHNPEYEKIKLYSRGAPIKKRAFELQPDDFELATWISTRRDQKNPREKYIEFTDRQELLRLAKLDGIKHSGMANSKLIQKFERLKEKGIIADYPKRIYNIIKLKIRD